MVPGFEPMTFECESLPITTRPGLPPLGKIIVVTGFEWLPKVQKIAQSGHTAWNQIKMSHFFLVPFPVKWTTTDFRIVNFDQLKKMEK